jgi:hypothetical protein
MKNMKYCNLLNINIYFIANLMESCSEVKFGNPGLAPGCVSIVLLMKLALGARPGRHETDQAISSPHTWDCHLMVKFNKS